MLLGDARIDTGFNKSLTFTGNGTITTDKQLTSNGEGWMCFGLYDPSRVLTLDGSGITWNWTSEAGTEPWLMISLSGTFNVTNGATMRFTVDSGSSGKRNAIYMNAGSFINVTNGSTFEIHGNDTDGKVGQGIQLDQAGTANINATGGSTFLIDGTNRGYVNSPSIYVEDSELTVQNCTANASNGGSFTAVRSQVVYQNNAGHGLSAGAVTLEDTDFLSDGNGYYGVYASSGFQMDGASTLTVTHNSGSGDFAGLKITKGVANGKVASGAIVEITDNYCSGLSNNGVLTFEEGANLTITDNTNDQGGATGSHGGGIYNSGAEANLTLPSNAIIYNNHALTDGDDIFNNTTSTITFPAVGSDWKLDGFGIDGVDDDCTDAIDGWYDDSAGARWEAHAGTYNDLHVEEYAFEGSTTTVTGSLALKAAHGLLPASVQPADITIYMGGDEGFEGVVDGNDQITGSDSLPEPGFYITLPDSVNAALGELVGTDEPANLSNYIQVYVPSDDPAQARHWTLEQYGDTYSAAYGKYIYRIVPAEGQDPIRLEFTDSDGNTYVSDEFDPMAEDALNRTYGMSLYAGGVDFTQLVMQVTVPDNGGTFYCAVNTVPGTLNVRYVTGEQDDVVTGVVTDIADAEQAGERAYAQVPEGAKFFINGSDVDVTAAAAPSLLFDDVVSDYSTPGAESYDVQLAARAGDVVASEGADMANPWYQTEYVEVENTEHGVRFTTDGFSPFVLMWDAGEEAGDQPEPPAAGDKGDGSFAATGDGAGTAALAVLACAALAAAVALAAGRRALGRG